MSNSAQQLEYPFADNEQWAAEQRRSDGRRPERRPTPKRSPTSWATAPRSCWRSAARNCPAADLDSALAQLRVAVPELLDELRLSYDGITVEGTPRRLAVMVDGLAARQTDEESVAKGPPADRAFDADGNPTKAATGFARSKGIDVADLTIIEEGGGRYVSAVVREEGRPAVAVLAEKLPELVAGIKYEKSMRWNETNVSYSRPLRWLLALHGTAVVPFAYAGVDQRAHHLRLAAVRRTGHRHSRRGPVPRPCREQQHGAVRGRAPGDY